MKLNILLIVILLFTFGCVAQGTKSDREIAIENCKRICENKLSAKEDISNGPCLSNNVTVDWVCDVAHSPREEIDNLPENQCSAYRAGEAHHFVELDPNCNLIRAI